VRAAVLGSLGVHAAAIVALFALHAPAPFIVPGPEVIQVSLVSPDSPPSPIVPSPPAPKPRPQPEVPAERGEGIKLAPPKKAPKVVKPAPVETPAEAAPALPWARAGNAGLAGQIQVDSRDFEFTYYLMLVRNRVAQNWAPPAGLVASGAVQALVYFQITRDGGVRGLRIETPSGLEYFDASVTRAVMLSNPLPPLPLGFTGPALGVHFGFQWGAP
jgi:outer membrane biosynthesis protein TonB